MSGRVKLMAYDRFIRAAGYVASAITLMLFLANQVIFIKKYFFGKIFARNVFFHHQAVSTGSTVWLAAWSDHSSKVAESGGKGEFKFCIFQIRKIYGKREKVKNNFQT